MPGIVKSWKNMVLTIIRRRKTFVMYYILLLLWITIIIEYEGALGLKEILRRISSQSNVIGRWSITKFEKLNKNN